MQFADIILKSNAIFTGTGEEVFRGGVAIIGNRIVAVKKDDEIDSLKGDKTKVYQYGDNLILPGFNDSHFHFAYTAAFEDDSFCIDLSACRSAEQCIDLLKEFDEKYPNNPWIFGRNWNYTIWDNPILPDRTSLDEIFPNRPVCINSWDCHALWINTKAYEVCGIDRNTPQPDGGLIEKDENGDPNGIILDIGATTMVLDYALLVPDLKSSVKKFLAKIAQRGITSVGDVDPIAVSNKNVYEIYKELEDEGALTTRINFYPELESSFKNAALKTKYTSEKLRFAGLKKFVDGVCETHTGYLVEPYADMPETKGVPLISEEQLKEEVIRANREGIDVRVHAIGEGAVRLSLNVYEASNKENGNAGFRNSIEHIETIQDSDVPRFKELGVVASMQPQHAVANIDGYPTLIGEERVKNAWAMKKISDSGAVLALNTDSPVVQPKPIVSIYSAITRTTVDGYPNGGFNSKEKLSMMEILKGWTYNGAYLEQREKDLGTLEEGKLADVIVLSKNLFEISEKEILDTKVLLTIMDGQATYEEK